MLKRFLRNRGLIDRLQ